MPVRINLYKNVVTVAARLRSIGKSAKTSFMSYIGIGAVAMRDGARIIFHKISFRTVKREVLKYTTVAALCGIEYVPKLN